MPIKVNISEFLAYFEPHAVVTNGKAPAKPPAHQYGYVMGGDGRVADDAYLRARAKASYKDKWEGYYKDTLKWRGRKVYDCNAAAEAFYKEKTGVSIDTKARLNYANWCSVKSSSKPDPNLTGMPQQPGIAVFSGGSSASGITHTGYLLRKYGDGPLDWYVLEFRGRNYGCVITRIKDRSWKYWGKMDKYFTYDLPEVAPAAPPKAIPKRTRSLKYELEITERISNVRTGPGMEYPIITKLGKGQRVVYLGKTGSWYKIYYNGAARYIHDSQVKACAQIHGDDVKAIQQALKDKGFDPGDIDGWFGRKTAAAVVAYQTAMGLEVDGIVGPITWESLFA